MYEPTFTKTTKTTATTLMPHKRLRTDKSYTIHWMDRQKSSKNTVWQFPIKDRFSGAALVLRNSAEAIVYGLRLSHIFEIPIILHEKPKILIKSLGF